MDKILANEEIRSLFSQLWEQDLAQNLMSLRLVTKKLVLMTDADVDGAHIRTPSANLDLPLYETNLRGWLCLHCPTTDLRG